MHIKSSSVLVVLVEHWRPGKVRTDPFPLSRRHRHTSPFRCSFMDILVEVSMLGTLLRRSQLGQTLPRATVYRFVACWKCGSELDTTSDYFCNISKCGAVQSYKITDVNAFQLFGLEQKYKIDMNDLDAQFKNAQKQLHPDKFSAKDIMERNASNETSSTVNQAYQVRTLGNIVRSITM